MQADVQRPPLRRYEDAARLSSPRRVGWGGIIAGSVVGLVVQLWLTLLGVAIGASAIDPLQQADPLRGIGIGSAIWFGLTVILSSFVGGWIAGRFSSAVRGDAALHGAASWAVSNIAMFMLVGTVFGAMVSGVTGLTRGVLDAASQVASGPAGERLDNAVEALRQNLPGQPGGEAGQAATSPAGDSPRLGQQARQVGDTAARTVAGAGWGIVILMALGLGAGLFGAAAGSRVNARSNA